MRWWWLLALTTGCADGPPADVRQRVPGTDPETEPPVPPPETTPVDETTLPAPPFLDSAVVADLTDAIDDLLSGTTHGVLIVDAENGQIVYESNPDDALTPASNTKLFTSATAMDVLGEEHRLRTRAFAPAQPDPSGRVASLTVLVEHDATWSPYFYEDQYFPADRLAAELYEAGVRSVTGALTLAGEVLVDGDSLGTYDEAAHRAAGVAVVEDALSLFGISVGSTGTSGSFDAPAGVVLAARESPPLSVVTHPLNVYSHNEMADLLANHNGWELWSGSSYADGEAATLDFLGDLGIDTTAIHFADGSGLSHDNTVTARSVVELILGMQRRPAGQAWERTFSIGGVIGTLDDRLTGENTAGRVLAKSGSLWNTIALSGVLYNRHDGHRYVFSILQNELTDQTQARAIADAVVETVAADLRGGGARPESPVLNAVINPGDGSIDVSWSAAAGAAAYGVWTSPDGLVWDRASAVVETGTRHTLAGLPAEGPQYVRVMAYHSTGESEASDVYAATPATGPSAILVVDGNDRWDASWENTRGTGHDFVRSVVEALPGRRVDSASNEAVTDGTVALTAYDAVIWLSGEESTDDATFDDAEQALVTAALDAGVDLLVSGAELGWDLDYLGTPDMQAFYHERLHASYVDDDSGTFTTLPTAGGIFDGMEEVAFYTPGRMVVDYPDRISASNGGDPALLYVGGDGGTAAVSFDGSYQLVNLGFPVESIDGRAQRTEFLERVLAFFGE